MATHSSILAWRVLNGGMGQMNSKTLSNLILLVYHDFAIQQTFSLSFSLGA